MRAKTVKSIKPPAITSSPLDHPLLSAEATTNGAIRDISEVQVSGNAVESLIANKNIGLRIRALRQKESMGLIELGRHAGLSASFLSQLETARVVPTLRNLARIAMVFSKDISYFFTPVPQTLFCIHRAEERVRLPQTGAQEPNYFFESLGYLVPDRLLDPYLAEFQPGNSSASTFHKHSGYEFLYVISGSLTIQHGDIHYELRTRDSVYFDSSTLHSYTCLSEEPASVLIVTLQQTTEVGPARLKPGRAAGRPYPRSPATGQKRH